MTITQTTKTTLGVVTSVVAVAVSGALWLDRRLSRLEDKVGGAYTLAAASEQALRMAIENPGLRVPDPRDPTKLLPVVARTIPAGGTP